MKLDNITCWKLVRVDVLKKNSQMRDLNLNLNLNPTPILEQDLSNVQDVKRFKEVLNTLPSYCGHNLL